MRVKFLQEGGAMPAQAPAEGGQEQLMAMAEQVALAVLQQTGDPQAAVAVLQAAAEVVMQAAQGGAPEAPVYARQGGSLQRIK